MEEKKFSIEELCTIFNIDLNENNLQDLEITIKNIKSNKVISDISLNSLFEGIDCALPINLQKL